MLINQDFSVYRSKYIGGSDIGAILGLSKFKTPMQVWMEKTGKPVGQMDSLPLRFGSFAEAFVANEYSKATGSELVHDESTYIHPKYSYMSAHIDRFVLGNSPPMPPNKILECKTANPFTRGAWGEPGTDQVPMSYLCQCIWYMAITQIDHADLAVLFGNSEFAIYPIARDLELEDLVISKAEHFWQEHVLKDCPPPPLSEQDCQNLFAKADPTKSIEANPKIIELIRELGQLQNQSDTCEQRISTIKQHIMVHMQEAETLSCKGQVVATWRAPKPSSHLDTKRLSADHPDLVAQYQIAIQNSRRLVIKNLKGEI